jgi:NADP-dependent 3-hydroxy acid dehydrogenase YdfG
MVARRLSRAWRSPAWSMNIGCAWSLWRRRQQARARICHYNDKPPGNHAARPAAGIPGLFCCHDSILTTGFVGLHMTDAPVTLITGGASGIGAATARRLLDQAHRVTITGRDHHRLGRPVDAGRRRGRLHRGPSGRRGHRPQVRAAGHRRRQCRVRHPRHPRRRRPRPMARDGPDQRARTRPTHQGRPTRFEADTGQIVLIGSVAAFVHTPGNIHGVTKWTVTGLAENTRRLVTGDGIGVTLIAPGRVATPFWDANGGPPAGGLLTADQIADSIVWAISQPSGVDVNTVIVRPIGQPG